MRAGIFDFFDTGRMQVISLSLVGTLAEAIVVLTLLVRRVGGRLHRKRIALGKFARADE